MKINTLDWYIYSIFLLLRKCLCSSFSYIQSLGWRLFAASVSPWPSSVQTGSHLSGRTTKKLIHCFSVLARNVLSPLLCAVFLFPSIFQNLSCRLSLHARSHWPFELSNLLYSTLYRSMPLAYLPYDFGQVLVVGEGSFSLLPTLLFGPSIFQVS
jgi:hypothetical protein